MTDIHTDNEQLQDSSNVEAAPTPTFEPGDNFDSIMQGLAIRDISPLASTEQDDLLDTPEQFPEATASELLDPEQVTIAEANSAAASLWETHLSGSNITAPVSDTLHDKPATNSDIEHGSMQETFEAVPPELLVQSQPSHQDNLFDKIDQTLSQSDAASHAMFSSIAEYKRVQDEITKLITMLGTGVQRKRQQATDLKHELSLKSHQQTALSAVSGSPEGLDEAAQVAACTQDADTSCDAMVHHTRAIQQNLGKDLTGCFEKLAQVEEETSLLKLRLKYIELLKSVTHDIDTLKELRVKAQDHKARFQSCSSFFQ